MENNNGVFNILCVARDLNRKGVALFKEQKYDDTLVQFQEALSCLHLFATESSSSPGRGGGNDDARPSKLGLRMDNIDDMFDDCAERSPLSSLHQVFLIPNCNTVESFESWYDLAATIVLYNLAEVYLLSSEEDSLYKSHDLVKLAAELSQSFFSPEHNQEGAQGQAHQAPREDKVVMAQVTMSVYHLMGCCSMNLQHQENQHEYAHDKTDVADACDMEETMSSLLQAIYIGRQFLKPWGERACASMFLGRVFATMGHYLSMNNRREAAIASMAEARDLFQVSHRGQVMHMIRASAGRSLQETPRGAAAA
jgi:hypothetical protein